MRRSKRTAVVAVLTAVGAVAIGALATGATPFGGGLELTNVPTANTRSVGFAPASKLSPELAQIAVAQGSTKVENPTAQVSYYGYDNDVVTASGEPQMVPTPAVSNEAHKTEPDKNTYLVFKKSLSGADPNYWYGTHFLFQGHEAGTPGNITRINLDADAAHRVTLLATADATGAPLATIDGSTGTRGQSGCCSPRRAPPHRPTRPRRATRPSFRTFPERSAAGATRASRTTTTATSGSSRTSAVPASPARRRGSRTASSSATCRGIPVTSRTASCRSCRC